jgi:hypothetical protein
MRFTGLLNLLDKKPEGEDQAKDPMTAAGPTPPLTSGMTSAE